LRHIEVRKNKINHWTVLNTDDTEKRTGLYADVHLTAVHV